MARKKARPVDPQRLKALFLDVCDTLTELGVNYHLEGGTLLGLIREQRLLPWDPDTDVSMMREDLDRLPAIIRSLKSKGWRVSIRHYETNAPTYAPAGAIRMIKVKGRSKWYFTPDTTCCDIFIKTRHEGHVYWQAKKCTMRVPEHHYSGFEVVNWEDRPLHVPVDAKGYLTAKYGNWSVPVKQWSARNELTIVKRDKSP